MPSSNFEGIESSSQPLPTSVFDIDSNTHESKLNESNSDEELESVEVRKQIISCYCVVWNVSRYLFSNITSL